MMRHDAKPPSVTYLDYAGACPMLPEVIAEHAECCTAYYANPHATTQLSQQAKQAIWRAEKDLLETLGIGAGEADIIWTAGGTEADNLGTLGLLRRARTPTAMVDAGAHPALLEPCRYAAKHERAELGAIPLYRNGQLKLEHVDAKTAAKTTLVGVTAVNNESGVILDLVSLRAWMNRCAPAARLLVDATQAFGKIDIPWREARIDLLALSGRKLGGPHSTGALVIRKGIVLEPLLHGGGQQHGVRAGTLDTVGILQMTRAGTIACARAERELARLRILNHALRDGLQKMRGAQVQILSPERTSPYILSIALPGYEGAVVMRLLAEKGIIVGTGSACSAESNDPSHVLQAMGIPSRIARSALRISMGWNTTHKDVDHLLTTLPHILRQY